MEGQRENLPQTSSHEEAVDKNGVTAKNCRGKSASTIKKKKNKEGAKKRRQSEARERRNVKKKEDVSHLVV